MLKPALDINPDDTWVPRAQARAFELVGFVNGAVSVEQYFKGMTGFIHPLLKGRKCAKRNDIDTGIELVELFLARAQLCGMFAAGYSAEMAQKNEQNMIAIFHRFFETGLSALNGLQYKIRG
jgi:hypothetical protein